MVYKMPIGVVTVKPRLGWLSYWMADDCTRQFYHVLEQKNSYVSASFYDKVFYNFFKYSVSETNLERFTRKFCENEEYQKYRFQALECDHEDLNMQDSYLIMAIKNQNSADAYCLLQKENVKFQSSLYDPKFIHSITNSTQYNSLVEAADDGMITCAEANQIMGCTLCKDINPRELG